MNTKTIVERVYGVDTIKVDIPDRVRELYRRGHINASQMVKANAIKEMWFKPLTRTPEYVSWARKQDSTVILCKESDIISGLSLRACRMQIVIDLIMQGNSTAKIEHNLRMSPNTALAHLKAALDEFEG